MATHEDVKKAKTLEELRSNLTEAELQRIQHQRDFDKIDKDHPAYRVGVVVDPMRQQLRKLEQDLENSLYAIELLVNQRRRMQAQLVSGIITEEVRDGVTMTREELEALIRRQGWNIKNQLYAIPVTLWQMVGFVGMHDMQKREFLTLAQYSAVVADTERRVTDMGFALFD